MSADHHQLPVETTNGTHSVLICRAEHPRSRRGDGRYEGRVCGKRLQIVPFAVRPTYRLIHDWADVHSGCLVVRCIARDCRAYTEYEITGALADGTGRSMASVLRAERRRTLRLEQGHSATREE
jgi:hypothetical protein